jgi:hypothetical protein
VPPAQAPAFTEALAALGAIEVEIAVLPLTLAELGDAIVSGNDLWLLGPLLADPETKEVG